MGLVKYLKDLLVDIFMTSSLGDVSSLELVLMLETWRTASPPRLIVSTSASTGQINMFRQNNLQLKTTFCRDDSLALTDDATSEGSHQATVVVEVILSLIFVGKLNFCIINVTRLCI